MTRPLTLRDWEARTRPGVICRVMKPQPVPPVYRFEHQGDGYFLAVGKTPQVERQFSTTWPMSITSPFQPGDRVWGRETWAVLRMIIDPETGYADDWKEIIDTPKERGTLTPVYKSDGNWDDHIEDRGFRWRSPATMPKWASRLHGTCTEVRAMRAGDVKEDMLERMGVACDMVDSGGFTPWDTPIEVPYYSGRFVDQFNADNPRTPYASNPWVWLYTMEWENAHG